MRNINLRLQVQSLPTHSQFASFDCVQTQAVQNGRHWARNFTDFTLHARETCFVFGHQRRDLRANALKLNRNSGFLSGCLLMCDYPLARR